MGVSDGESIKAFEDPWIRGKGGFMVEFKSDNIDRGLKVCDLIVPGENRWEVDKVNNLFLNCDAKIILAILVPKVQVADRIAWLDTMDGKYMVRSGYACWHKHFSNCRNESVHKRWINLWKLDVPRKVSVFLWRLCKNNVPIRSLLRGRGIQTTILCPMCGTDVTHVLHIFLDCTFTKNCRRALGWEFNTNFIESFLEWL